MTLEELNNKTKDEIDGFEHIVIPQKNAWMNEDFTDCAMIDGKDVYLDCEDNCIRETVFRRSVLHYLKEHGWVDESATVDNLFDVVDCLINPVLFSDYKFFHKSDYAKIKDIWKERDDSLKTLWKTDDEFFCSCIDAVVDYSDDSISDIRYRIDRNNYGFTFADIRNNPVAKSHLLEKVWNEIENSSEEWE